MRIALAQIDPTVGDIDGNAAKIAEWIGRARAEGAELVDLPRALRARLPGRGPLPEAPLRRGQPARGRGAGRRGRAASTALVGFAEPAAGGGDFRHAHNSLAVLADGAVRAVYRKNRLPNYAVFDEQRYFVPGDRAGDDRGRRHAGRPDDLRGRLGRRARRPRPRPQQGAQLIANPSGSPYHRGKGREREADVRRAGRAPTAPTSPSATWSAARTSWSSTARASSLDPDGEVIARAAQFEEELLVCEVPRRGAGPARRAARRPRRGLRRRSSSACATTSARTASATSASRSRAASTRPWWRCSRPTRSAPSGSAAWSCPRPIPALKPRRTPGLSPRNLGAELIEIPIEAMMDGYERRWPAFATAPATPSRCRATRPALEPDLAAENIQARIRGNLMMALSNKHGWLVLTTGNKSEMSVGYATLYGDMAGGFAVIKDVPKTLVYELVRHRNERAGRELVPASVIERRALGRAAPRPARQRLAAPLRPARPHPRGLRRARRGPRGDDRRRACRPRSSTRSSAWSTAPSTSAARRRPGSGSPRRPSAATGASRSPTASAARPRPLSASRPDGDRHLGASGAELAPSSSTDLGLPDPGGAAAVAGAGADFGVALGDRADEADADRLAHRHHPVAEHRERGGAGADALDQARHHAAVQEPERLAQLVAHRRPGRGRASGSSSSHSVPSRASKWECSPRGSSAIGATHRAS